MAVPDTSGSYKPTASTVRARLMLEVAAAMGDGPEQAYREPEIRLQPAGDGAPVTLAGTSTLDGVGRVVSGEVALAFLNPSSALAVALRGGNSVFPTPQPVRSVAVLPSRDQCCFAVRAETGLGSIEDIGRSRYPLRLSLRGVATHWLHTMLDDIFAAAGFSVAELQSWGGAIRKQGHIPHPGSPRFEALRSGAVDAVFDEGVHGWVDSLVPAGMTVLPMEEATLARLEAMGYRRDLLRKARYPTLPADVPTLDFSGWPLFVREDADADFVRRVCEGLEARKNVIPWEGGPSVDVARMVADSAEAPLGAPLHDAAAAFWRARGYI